MFKLSLHDLTSKNGAKNHGEREENYHKISGIMFLISLLFSLKSIEI